VWRHPGSCLLALPKRIFVPAVRTQSRVYKFCTLYRNGKFKEGNTTGREYKGNRNKGNRRAGKCTTTSPGMSAIFSGIF
jgi:hypothetical protein